MNLVYPLARGTGPLVTVLVAVLVLGDPTSALALVGVGLVVAGVLVISFGRRNPASPHRRRVGIALRRRRPARASRRTPCGTPTR